MDIPVAEWHVAIDAPHVWGSYDFGLHTGVFRVEERPWRGSNERLSLRWRGRHEDDNDATQGDGWISFVGKGRIKGIIELSDRDPSRFQGVKDEQAGPGRTRASLSRKWDGYASRLDDDDDDDDEDDY